VGGIYTNALLANMTKNMKLEATIKCFDPIRVAVDDPIFNEPDPAIRATLDPAVCYPSTPPASPSAPPSSPSAPPAPSDSDLRYQAAYYKSMHQRAAAHVKVLQQQLADTAARCRADANAKAADRIQVLQQQLADTTARCRADANAKAADRIAALELDLAAAKARIRQLEQQLFGRKAEAYKATDKLPTPADPLADPPSASSAISSVKRPRGQRRQKPGPQRRDHSALPLVEETIELPAERCLCSACGLPFETFPGTEDSEVLEINVNAYRRVIKRRRYRPVCGCGAHQGIITAPVAPRVIPKNNLGVSVLVEILLDKFCFYRPTYRLLSDWRTRGLDLSLGTVTGCLRRLAPLFKPVYEALIDHLRKQNHWHGDETRWSVFAKTAGKAGYRWMIWVLHSQEVIVYVLDPTRAHEVPEETLGPDAQGTMSVDRYSAYKAMKQVKDGKILLSFCWAHVRRDFLEVMRSWPKHEEWGFHWIGQIGLLYKTNEERIAALAEPEVFKIKDEELRKQLEAMAQERDKELSDQELAEPRRKVLASLVEHWQGLVVFVDKPSVPMDNNQAERDLRGVVVLRKNSYGSGAKWAGELAAMVFSVMETLEMWNINPRQWLTAYLQECAREGGKAPGEVKGYLPWEMSAEKKKEWALEQKSEDSS